MSCNHSFHLGVNTLFHVPGDVGGTETYLREMVVAMAQEFPRLRITLFTHFNNDAVVRDWLAFRDDIQFVRLPFAARIRPLRIIVEQSVLPFYVAQKDIDVLWSPGYTAPFFLSCPGVVTVCDLQYKTYPEDMGCFARITFDLLIKAACRSSRSIVAISEFSKQEIIRNRFAKKEEIHTIHLGVDQSFARKICQKEADALLSNYFDYLKPYILCVAHTYPHKNLDLLVETFVTIEQDLNYNLVLVGKPRRGEEKLRAAVEDLVNPSRFVRLKEVPYRTLQGIYQHADMFVFTSAYEGFGLPVIEAMMARVPVLCSKNGSLREIAGPGAFIFDSLDIESIAEKIRFVNSLSPEQKRKKLEEAQAWAMGFKWQQSARKMVRVLEKAIRPVLGSPGQD
jgi:glycosyltransferase involved in cell wall biosynthesis